MSTTLVFIAMLVVGYFIPTLVAWRRNNKNRSAIGVLNLCLGWTFIGWVVALVWAVKND